MTATYIPLKELPNYLDPRLRDICSAAVIDDDPLYDKTMLHACDKIQQWASTADDLIHYVEYHGLSGVLYSLYRKRLLGFQNLFLLQLKGAVVKHDQRACSIAEVLKHLHEQLNRNGIPFILLKGAALAHDIYQHPSHRAMADVDILVDENLAERANQICLESGFSRLHETDSYTNVQHHLPALTIKRGQHSVFLEIHKQALSTDIGVQIKFSDAKPSVLKIAIHDRHFKVFGHTNMLRHLCLHTFSRDQIIKLSAVVDLFRYCLKYENEIDWPYLEQHYVHVINTLRCCRMLISLPEEVLTVIKEPKTPITGLGLGMLPLREYRNANLSIIDRYKMILFPSRWWQHVFYNIAPEKALFFTRYIKHPFWVLRWGLNRLKNVGSKGSNQN